MSTVGVGRGLCAMVLAFDAVVYAFWVGFWPSVGWLVALVVVKFIPEEV